MPSYKLMYFNVRGRGEGIRLLFAQAGVDYEDCRLTGEEFRDMKTDPERLPLGQLPVLIVDNNPPIPQSSAIERYLAREFGMYGKNTLETIRIDVVCETVLDLFNGTIKFAFEKDEATKAKKKQDFMETDSVNAMKALSKGLQYNNQGKGYFVGTTMTLADIRAFVFFEIVEGMMPEMLDKYSDLKDFQARMKKEPKIAAWLAKRPESSF
ncbi:S-crystallin SL11-like [Diadema antillarum]|uniref:S-crystallin SL11-like n=1 Tax=Diadema antillarum TaxID=105358 RepID=UPI003A857AD7